MNSYILLISFILFALATPILLRGYFSREGFGNSILASMSAYPEALTEGGILNDYPHTGRKGVSNVTSQDVWWRYPIFDVGSYDQITNNLRFVDSPDDGRCTRVEFCETLYSDKQVKSNVVYPLPPVPNEPGKRIGYYNSPINLMTFENNDTNLY